MLRNCSDGRRLRDSQDATGPAKASADTGRNFVHFHRPACPQRGSETLLVQTGKITVSTTDSAVMQVPNQ